MVSAGQGGLDMLSGQRQQLCTQAETCLLLFLSPFCYSGGVCPPGRPLDPTASEWRELMNIGPAH